MTGGFPKDFRLTGGFRLLIDLNNLGVLIRLESRTDFRILARPERRREGPDRPLDRLDFRGTRR